MGILEATWFLPVVGGIIFFILFISLLVAIYKVADVNKILIVTGLGCKEPKVKISGGTFVIPILQKAKYFPLDIMTISETGDNVRTNGAVQIIIRWTAQVNVQTEDKVALVKTIRLFISSGIEGMKESVKQTIQANVREIIAGMTPEEVLSDKKVFVQNVLAATEPDLKKLGLEMSTLNINDVDDDNEYYDNMAAKDTEAKRQEAEIVRANANRAIRENVALADQEAKEKELAAELIIAEKQRNNDVKKAEFKVETETADAKAEMAKEIQSQTRQVELNEQTGIAEAKAKEREKITAEKQNEIAETEAKRVVIQAQGAANADATKQKIGAEAAAAVAKTSAAGIAEAAKIEADGKAEAIKLQAEAEKEKITKTGTAEADVIRAKGMAEADSIKAKGLAEAEAERALADARAANEGVNFEIAKLEIESKMRIEVATNVAQVMADLGSNAKFVNIGGSGTSSGKTGNVLLDTLAGIPELMMMGDVKSEAMNSTSFMNDIGKVVNTLFGRDIIIPVEVQEEKTPKEITPKAQFLDTSEFPSADEDKKVGNEPPKGPGNDNTK